MILREYDSWILEIHGGQPTLGSAVIRFKRSALSSGLKKLAALTREEMQELEEVMRDYERALQPEFLPDAVHYFLLGNRDPKLHFHAIPRYRTERKFAGRIWQDRNFGRWPDMRSSDAGDMQEIVQVIQSRLPASEPKVLFYFVRHGETEWNKKTKALGHLDISINADGFTQAQELKQLLAPLTFDWIVSSDLKRAHDTARIVAEGRGQTILQDRRLRSRDWKELTGKASTLLYITNPELFECVETNESMEERIFHFLEEFAAAHPKERILVVCHGSILRIIMSKVLGFAMEGVITVRNTASLQLSRRKNTWKLEEIKDIQLPMELRFTR